MTELRAVALNCTLKAGDEWPALRRPRPPKTATTTATAATHAAHLARLLKDQPYPPS